MKILFIHQNFPGQYKYIAQQLAACPDVQVTGIGEKKMVEQRGRLPGVHTVCYDAPQPTHGQVHHYLRGYEAAVRRGQAVARVLLDMRDKGYVPDVVCVHPGWGEALFVRDVFPASRILMFAEFYFRAGQADIGFDPEFPASVDWNFSVRIRNSPHIMSLITADACISPSHWQVSRFPDFVARKTHVVHDGVNCAYMTPSAIAQIRLQRTDIPCESRVLAGDTPLGDGVVLGPADRVLTFVNRNLEPYRGFHVFMRALPEIQRRNPDAHILIVGGEETSYSPALPAGQSYKERYLAEVRDRLDCSRIHFLGRVPYATLRALFRLSSAHVYLTYPFVLSWSVMEALACECLVIGSKTPPVEEVIRHGENGLLVDFFDRESLVETVTRALHSPEQFAPLRKKARETIVQGFELTTCLGIQEKIIRQMATSG